MKIKKQQNKKKKRCCRIETEKLLNSSENRLQRVRNKTKND